MTVAQLIEALGKLPLTLQVIIPAEDLEFCVVEKALAEVAWVDG